MPFTTSHPAAVIPLKWLLPKYVSLSGLMAGAMSPDFLYFLILNTTSRGVSHSWPGLILFCLPSGLLFCFAFHRFFKREFIDHLPLPLRSRMNWLAETRFEPKGLRQWVVLTVSVLTGALSHFFWDSWTHETGEMVSHFPVLLSTIQLSGNSVPLHRFLQHASTAAGALFVIRRLLRTPQNSRGDKTFEPKSTKDIFLFQFGGLLAAIGMVALALTIHAELRWPELLFESELGFIGVIGGLSSWTGYICYVCTRGVLRQWSETKRANR